jgi:hypothetical protein
MLASRQLPIVLAVLACAVWNAAAVSAGASPERPAIAPATHDPAAEVPIQFYLAHGEADACGAGCSEWIAAEGKIDATAAQRLRQLLAKLKGRRPPVFFHSPGGSVNGSMELGRLIHQQKLTVSVGRTLPLGCDRDKLLEQSCVALKRSGHEVEAKLDPTIAMCNSGCVYALTGGVVHLVPPWVRIGIHDMSLEQSRNLPRSGLIAAAKRAAYARLRNYLHDVGADESLLEAAMTVPSNSLKPLQRDEIVRLGIDRREFDETSWQFVDKPTPSIRKRFFVRTDSERTHYVDGLMSMDCGLGLSMHVVLARQYLAAESASPLPAAISIAGKPVRMARGDSQNLYVRTTYVRMNTFDEVADTATIVVPGTELGRKDPVTLNMDGFSAAHAKLQKICPEAGRIAQEKALLKGPIPGSQILTAVRFPPAAQSTAAWQNTQGAAAPVAHPTTASQEAAAPPTESPTGEITRIIAAGQKLRVDFLADIQPDCSSAGQTTVRILDQPQHGTVTIEEGQGFTVFPENHPSSACNSRKSEGTLVFYQPSQDYLGPDSITLQITFPLGGALTRHYTIRVK